MKVIFRISSFAIAIAFALLANSCEKVHEFPEGGGSDPTEIVTKINLKVHLDMEIDMSIVKSADPIDVKKETADKYDSRFFVEIRNGEYDSEIVESYTICRPASDTSSLVINTNLHARKYKLVIWMDYVTKGDTTDLYYNTGNGKSLTSIKILDREHYLAGTDFKNTQHYLSDLDLTPYAGQWHCDITINAPLKSPMAKIRFLANDLDKYAESISWPYSLDSLARSLHMEFFYTGWLPTGFNASTGLLNDSDVGYGFKHNCYYPESFRDVDYTLVGSDFVFVNRDSSSVNVSASIKDGKGAVIKEVSSINVPIVKGKETVIIYKFFTKEYVPGIGINPAFDGEWNIYV